LKNLRPYQQECIETVISEYNSGVDKQLIVLHTGAGKTFLLIKLLERMGFKRILWLSFQEELVSQSAMAFIRDKYDEQFYNKVAKIGFLDYLREYNEWPSGFSMGCIKADIFLPDADVVMGSVMTVARRLDRIAPDFYDCVICDEAHLFMSKTSYDTLQYLKPKFLCGATATAHRADGLPLGDLFDKITFQYGLDRGIKDGYACQMDAIRIKTNVSLDGVKTTAGELNQRDLSDEINTLARNQLIVDSYAKYCSGMQCIAFCVDIQHAIDLAQAFKDNGYDCEAVSSNEELTPDRSEKIARYKAGKLQIITNVSVLVAGFDAPDTGCIIMACPTKSLTKYLQSVGRGSRLKSTEFVSKFGQMCIILDVVDNTTKHNLINAWELDRELPPEDRVFISQEKKDKLILSRRLKLEHSRDKDERVSLLKIPKIKPNNSIRQLNPATEKQLKWIYDLGYPKDVHYTYQMCNDIINNLPATEKQVNMLRALKYDVSGRVVTRADVQAVMKDVEKRESSATFKKKGSYNK